MIQSFSDKRAQKLWDTQKPQPAFGELNKIILRKLTMLHAAQVLSDLMAPPNNKLEKLKGDRQGQHSIRINSQFRICFAWTSAGPEDVEVTDYH